MYRVAAILILAVFSVLPLQLRADEDRVCAPFRDGVVDNALVSKMLEAAKDGHLYRIRSTNSRIGFCVDSLIGTVEAEFHGFRGGLALRHEVWGDASQMMVMIDADSLDTDASFIENMLKSERFFNAGKFPKILFVSGGLVWDSDTTASLFGNLSMHGVTRPVLFRVELTNVIGDRAMHEQEIIVTATAHIRRSDFGMDALSMVVSDWVKLCMRVDALRYEKPF
jgi:polyisoprenoid-binding protein YceI